MLSYEAKKQMSSDILKAWEILRTKDSTIPDDIIDLMKDAALEKINNE